MTKRWPMATTLTPPSAIAVRFGPSGRSTDFVAVPVLPIAAKWRTSGGAAAEFKDTQTAPTLSPDAAMAALVVTTCESGLVITTGDARIVRESTVPSPLTRCTAAPYVQVSTAN